MTRWRREFSIIRWQVVAHGGPRECHGIDTLITAIRPDDAILLECINTMQTNLFALGGENDPE